VGVVVSFFKYAWLALFTYSPFTVKQTGVKNSDFADVGTKKAPKTNKKTACYQAEFNTKKQSNQVIQ